MNNTHHLITPIFIWFFFSFSFSFSCDLFSYPAHSNNTHHFQNPTHLRTPAPNRRLLDPKQPHLRILP